MDLSKFIYDWLKDILVIFIFISIFNLIMPKGNMKRYTDHIIGILIIFTIISPIRNLGKIKFNIDQEVFNNSHKNISNYNEDIFDNYNEEVERIYLARIRGELEKLIDDNSDFTLDDLSIDIYREGENYGLIGSIKIVLKDRTNLDRDISKIEVKKIESPKKKDLNSHDKENVEKLKELISNNLGISRETIYISIKN